MSARRLPLFPLPVVLFPGAMMPLHIFEPRYREMVATILETDRCFGLLYHDPDEHGPFLNEEGRIGTVAQIQQHEPLPDGRSIILVRGLERFRVRIEVEEGSPYYEAMVEDYLDRGREDLSELISRRGRSLELLQAAVDRAAGRPSAPPPLNVDGEVSFRMAAMIRADPAWQQELLESQDEADRLDRLDRIFRGGLPWSDPDQPTDA